MKRTAGRIVLAALAVVGWSAWTSEHAAGQSELGPASMASSDFSTRGETLGACCIDGGCQDNLTQTECVDDFCGAWQGPGSSCGAILLCPTPAGGICCVDGECMTQAQIGGVDSCECAGGTYYQSPDSCSGVVCPGGTPGACCIDGQCIDGLTLYDCEVNSCGLWRGEGSTCEGSPLACPAVERGVCCLGDVCTTGLGPDSCECAAGEYMTGITNCDDAACTPAVGRCCRGGICTPDLTEAECDAICGHWGGPGSDCSSGGGPIGSPPCGILALSACCMGDQCVGGLSQYTCTCEGGTYIPNASCQLTGTQGDCNTNGIADICEDFEDCNSNGKPDECEKDCNTNGVPDDCDVAGGTSPDCNTNGTPDECDKDCNFNGVPDDCDIAAGTSLDCNTNGMPDECEFAADCDGNGIPDECEFGPDCIANEMIDCNFDGVTDACDPDCDISGESDICELTFGLATDCTGEEGFIGNFSIGQSLHNNNCAFCHGEGGYGQGGFPNHRNRSRYEYQRKTANCQILIGHGGGAFDFTIEDLAHLERYLSDYGPEVAGDGVPDQCQDIEDCNSDGLADECALSAGFAQDCNSNGVPDDCDIDSGASVDCDTNGVPDECEQLPDCNSTGIGDPCEIAAGSSSDCNMNGVPDECEADCNTNGIADDCEGLPDCDTNGVPDECDPDCNTNGQSDVCEILGGFADDCDTNGVPDDCDPDCNTNGIADPCDIASGASDDLNGNGIPDECDPDCNGNGIPDELDIIPFTSGILKDVEIDYGTTGVIIPDCAYGLDEFLEDSVLVDFGSACEKIEHFTVDLEITHNWSPDLVVELISPAGTAVTLMSRVGYDEFDPYCSGGECCGPDIQHVLATFDDDASTCVEDASTVAGTFHPFAGATGNAGELSAFIGEPQCGEWTLRIHDGAEYDEGTLWAWSLHFREPPFSEDCNDNKTPDECEVAGGTAADADSNGIPDECSMAWDCNSNGISDDAEIAAGSGEDCNGNGVLDACELAGVAGMFVTGLISDNVVAFDYDSARNLGEFVSPPAACVSGLDLPFGLTFAPNGDLLVGDGVLPGVRAYDGNTGAYLSDFVPAGSGGINLPVTLEFGPDGNLFVLRYSPPAVLKYDGQSGGFLGEFVNFGLQPNALDMTFGPNGNLYVADAGTAAVQEYDGVTGAPLGAFTSGGALITPLTLDFGPNGNLFVADSQTLAIEEYDGTTGAFIRQFGTLVGQPGFLAHMEFGPDGHLYVPYAPANSVIRYDGTTGAPVALMQPSVNLVTAFDLTFRPAATDCDGNGVPDDCEDCNTNGIGDACDLAAGTSADSDSNGIPDECQGEDVALELVIREVPSASDTSPFSPPRGIETIEEGDTFYVEVWARDQGALNTGLAEVYADLTFDPEAVDAESVDNRPPFTTNPGGTIDNLFGRVDGLGGSDASSNGVGIAPQWVRVAVVEFSATFCPHETVFALEPAGQGIVAVGRGEIAPQYVAFGQATLTVTFECTYNLVDENDRIDVADFGAFAECWLTGPGDVGFDPDCDFDCSGFVDVGDLGWFVNGWLKTCDELVEEDVPPCRRCPQVCGGFPGILCEEPNTFCKTDIGRCCCDFPGVCTPIPQGCPEYLDPVCGCDGVTYSNECEAEAASMSLAHKGPCPDGPSRAASDGQFPEADALSDSSSAFTAAQRVRIGYRITPAGALNKGDSAHLELFVRDGGPDSRGVTGVFVAVGTEQSEAIFDQIQIDADFPLFQSAPAAGHELGWLGGATLETGAGAGAWKHFASMRVTATTPLPAGPGITIKPLDHGLALPGFGIVSPDDVRVTRLGSVERGSGN